MSVISTLLSIVRLPLKGLAAAVGATAVAARASGLPPQLIEAALIGAVLLPLAVCRPVAGALRGIGRRRQVALGIMLALALGGQLFLDARSFPFIKWAMYATVVHGDADVIEYDAVLRSGRRVPLVPGRFMGAESADRLMEAMRRQVLRLRDAGGDPRAAALRTQHEQTLAALARRYGESHPSDPIAAVLVTEKTIALDSGNQTAPTTLWRVRIP